MILVEQIYRNFSHISSVMISMTGTLEMPPAPTRGALERQLEQLKQRLLRPVVERISNTELARELSWAANEAAALAWLTVCPILVLPALLDEKVRAALKRWEKQRQLRPQQTLRAQMTIF
jgi:hypothetical protein